MMNRYNWLIKIINEKLKNFLMIIKNILKFKNWIKKYLMIFKSVIINGFIKLFLLKMIWCQQILHIK